MARRRTGLVGYSGTALRLAVILGLVVGVGLSCQLRRAGPPLGPVAPAVQAPAPSPPPRAIATPTTALVHPRRATPPPAAETGPRVAIIFDDAGGSLADVEEIIAIGRPVTVAVLPGLRYSTEVARRALAAGLEVLLHLPLEANDDTHALGPDGITVSMDDAEIRATVHRALRSVPGAIGINNHMGSRGTADRRVMRAVLEVIRDRGLFFVDSRTTAATVAESVAAELGVRVASRALFLDNVNEVEAVRREVERLLSLARAQGEVIAIGHAQRLTPRVVAQMLDEFDRQGVRIVPLSSLVK